MRDIKTYLRWARKYPYIIIILLAFPVFLFSGYVSRAEVDTRLARACYAAVEQFLDNNLKIAEIRDTEFTNDSYLGEGYRKVVLAVVVGNHAYDKEEDYSCIFQEHLLPLRINYSAQIYQLKMGDKIYGRQGDKTFGEAAENEKLFQIINNILNPQ